MDRRFFKLSNILENSAAGIGGYESLPSMTKKIKLTGRLDGVEDEWEKNHNKKDRDSKTQ